MPATMSCSATTAVHTTTAKNQAAVGHTYPLEEANQALENLRAGHIVGRAVLTP